ncbi:MULTISPECIES: hypothetical protein [Vibrio]|uniref:hypothetical protein n=1 Tax=Vibrio TaxID=662 RepID=UPI0003626EB7|nr:MULTISPECIES: hypothetical protein [Vibrio]
MAEYQTIIVAVATGCVSSIATVAAIRVDIDWLKIGLGELKVRVVELEKNKGSQ